MSGAKDVNSPLLPTGAKTYDPQIGSPSVPSNQSKAPTSPQKPGQANPTPVNPATLKNLSWGAPAGLSIRGPNDENLVILEEGRTSAVGIYRSVIREQQSKAIQHAFLTAFLYLCYFAQIVIGAALTAIGPTSGRYQTLITVLGAVNTVLAGLLALIKGSGQPQRLEKDRVGFRRLQDWIEETEALLAVGVIGRNRKEVGLLVESAFKRYNAAKMSVENNSPDFYVNQPDSNDDHSDAAGKPLKPNGP